MQELQFFTMQLQILNAIVTTKTIVLGDFNLDLNKEHSNTYSKKSYIATMQNTIGHHNLDQLVKEDTWSRVINNVYTSSRIDHIYSSETHRINNLQYCENAYSDHKMIEFTLTHSKKLKS